MVPNNSRAILVLTVGSITFAAALPLARLLVASHRPPSSDSMRSIAAEVSLPPARNDSVRQANGEPTTRPSHASSTLLTRTRLHEPILSPLLRSEPLPKLTLHEDLSTPDVTPAGAPTAARTECRLVQLPAPGPSFLSLSTDGWLPKVIPTSEFTDAPPTRAAELRVLPSTPTPDPAPRELFEPVTEEVVSMSQSRGELPATAQRLPEAPTNQEQLRSRVDQAPASAISPATVSPGPLRHVNGLQLRPGLERRFTNADNRGSRFGVAATNNHGNGVRVVRAWRGYPGTRLLSPQTGVRYVLEPNDIIMKINGLEIHCIHEYDRAVKSSPRQMLLEIRNGRNGRTILLEAALRY